jgi:hypothetical protein
MRFAVVVLLVAAGARAETPAPSPEEQARTIEHARTIALEYSAAMPNFLCTETVQRYIAKNTGDPLSLKDTLAIDVAANGKAESYHLLSIDGKPTTKTLRNVGGAKSTGEFDSLLRLVFHKKSETRFEWLRWEQVRGRLAHVFAFHIDQEHSEYLLDFRGGLMKQYRATTAAKGAVYLDAETHKPLRLESEAENIPQKWPVRAVSSALDYDLTDIGGQPYLLPRRYETLIVYTNGQRRNVTEFGNYRRFSAEATVNFEK